MDERVIQQSGTIQSPFERVTAEETFAKIDFPVVSKIQSKTEDRTLELSFIAIGSLLEKIRRFSKEMSSKYCFGIIECIAIFSFFRKRDGCPCCWSSSFEAFGMTEQVSMYSKSPRHQASPNEKE